MEGLREIILLSFIACAGVVMVFVACVLEHAWYPLIACVLFVFGGVPICLNNRMRLDSEEGCEKLTAFITGVVLTTGVGLLVCLYHANAISIRALAISIPGGILVFGSIYRYSRRFVAQEE